MRQRSNLILGWETAAAAGRPLGSGTSAGAVGSAGSPALGSWMMLPELTTPATRTVLHGPRRVPTGPFSRVFLGVALKLLLEPLWRPRRPAVRQTGLADTDDGGSR